MSMKGVLVIALALACGFSAVLGVIRLRQPPDGTAAKIEMMPVVVAAKDIARGKVVVASDLEICDWPKDSAPEGVVTRVEDAVDRSTKVPVTKGDLVRSEKLAGKEAGRGMAAIVPKGMRAYTITASRVASSVAGFIQPGNRVDILLNIRGTQDDGTGGGSTTTLLQSVEILAVDQRLDESVENHVNPKDLSSVTLLVTPGQAALLDLGQNVGQMTLALRNAGDTKEAATRPATLNDIRFRQEKPVTGAKEVAGSQPPKEPDVMEILTLRGSRQGRMSVTVK